jgi:pyruvate/2-oxoglutarate dehydrogenase complex dihydrolipoamide dehydrogenase (E3) component
MESAGALYRGKNHLYQTKELRSADAADKLTAIAHSGYRVTEEFRIKVKKGLFPWTASGRAIANGRDEGVTKLLFDDSPEEGSDGHAGRGHGKILGGSMVGTHAGDMIGEIVLAIEMGLMPSISAKPLTRIRR